MIVFMYPPNKVQHEIDPRKNINLRLADIKDAEFILEQRMQKHKVRFLNQVDKSLQKQRAWLKAYKGK